MLPWIKREWQRRSRWWERVSGYLEEVLLFHYFHLGVGLKFSPCDQRKPDISNVSGGGGGWSKLAIQGRGSSQRGGYR